MDEVSSSILHRKVFVARRLANVSGSWRDNKSGNSTPCPPFWEKLRELNVFPVGRGESDPDDTGTLCGSYLRNLWWSCFTERAEVPRLCFPPSLSTWADILKISIWKEELKKSALPTKKKGGGECSGGKCMARWLAKWTETAIVPSCAYCNISNVFSKWGAKDLAVVWVIFR